MDIDKVLPVLIQEFQKQRIDFALIGGLALQLAGVNRKTHDIDFQVLLKDSDRIDGIMQGLGYKQLHRTENVANYQGLAGLGQVDFLFAQRKYSLRMLANAKTHSVLGLRFKAIRPEDLIGLKVQSSSNDPRRTEQDMLDIKGLLQANAGSLDLEMIREYFKLFKREKELNKILKAIK